MSLDIEQEWETYLNEGRIEDNILDKTKTDGDSEENQESNHPDNPREMPKCSNIYISTRTKIAYINQTIPLNEIFWSVPLINYTSPEIGVIKKQMKFNSLSQIELDELIVRTENITEYKDVNQIQHVEDERRNLYKDVRKLSIGISKKDILSYRLKKKGAFYNCFVLIFRICIDSIFKEVHVKVFNTGKIEIPGVQDQNVFIKAIEVLRNTIQPYFDALVVIDANKSETVLINSNFHCGYLIDRDKLVNILKTKYNLNAVYNPCEYPGIQCKYKYNQDEDKNEDKYISFMIFRTGSVLIVGKCDDDTLKRVYEYLKNILENEYENVHQIGGNEEVNVKPKISKVRKRMILVEG